jgi:hypothetical protein
MYDGHTFTVYRHDPGESGSLRLRDNFIESLYEDRSGTPWIGTQDGWLERSTGKVTASLTTRSAFTYRPFTMIRGVRFGSAPGSPDCSTLAGKVAK